MPAVTNLREHFARLFLGRDRVDIDPIANPDLAFGHTLRQVDSRRRANSQPPSRPARARGKARCCCNATRAAPHSRGPARAGRHRCAWPPLRPQARGSSASPGLTALGAVAACPSLEAMVTPGASPTAAAPPPPLAVKSRQLLTKVMGGKSESSVRTGRGESETTRAKPRTRGWRAGAQGRCYASSLSAVSVRPMARPARTMRALRAPSLLSVRPRSPANRAAPAHRRR